MILLSNSIENYSTSSSPAILYSLLSPRPHLHLGSLISVHTYCSFPFSLSRLLRNTLTRRYTSIVEHQIFSPLEVNTLSAYNYGKYSYPIYLFALHHFLHTIILLDFENLISCFEYVHEMELTESNFQATLPH